LQLPGKIVWRDGTAVGARRSTGMRSLRLATRVGALLAVVVLLAAGAWLAGAVPPYGPIAGGRLRGETVAQPPSDWSFVDRVAEVAVETRLGPLPWSVTTWVFAHEGRLYLPARNCLAKRWVKNLLAAPDVRVRIEGRLYDLRAVREEDPGVARALLEQMLAKYLGVEAEGPTLVADGGSEASARATVCAFRMEPRR
jgi:hypothetical protein